MAQTILVVDDEQDIRELLRYNLTKEGYAVECVASGEEALRRARSRPPDLIVLDLMLPGVDGLEVCRRLKGERRTAAAGIVMLTAKGEDADVVAGLELGADDYVIKPFSPRVLLARIRAALRRPQLTTSDDGPAVIERGDITIDLGRYQVTAGGEPVSLTALEMRILLALLRRPGLVMTRYQIVTAAQGEGIGVTDRSVDVHIVSLRRKLGDCGKLIETVRGVGYRFRELEIE
ncbi:MAG: response regulator transcription factor [bacterium]|nr:response regulator transcription factor [bacterium]